MYMYARGEGIVASAGGVYIAGAWMMMPPPSFSLSLSLHACTCDAVAERERTAVAELSEKDAEAGKRDAFLSPGHARLFSCCYERDDERDERWEFQGCREARLLLDS